MKITKIQIKHFRAFQGEYEINLFEGRNLLVYGENGSGKSSLYQALNLFLAPATPFADQKNIFVVTDDGFVRLEIGDGTNPTRIYEWEQASHPFAQAIIAEAAKTKGFFDYRALLETHFIHRRADSVNIFDLLINSVLANTMNPITGSTLSSEWSTIQQTLVQTRSQRRDQRQDELLSDFNLGLTNILTGVTDGANQVLAAFDQNLSVQLALPPSGLVLNQKRKSIDAPAILLTATYFATPLTGHHQFLNEARLSAIALSIYLSALLLNPPSQLRVLFLDDVLIGLDMSNRLPLLDVLKQHFDDWQIILTTYDRVWFEMVRLGVMGQTPKWTVVEFFCEKTSDGDLPVYQQNKDFLEVAHEHLNRHDLKAAAIYIRSAYEVALKRFCDKHDLAVRYCQNSKNQTSEDFWQVVKVQKFKTGGDVLSPTRISEIELYRASVLNQLSHTAPVSLVHAEVNNAYSAVDQLKRELEGIVKGTLART